MGGGAPKPAFLFTHAPTRHIFGETGARTVRNPAFDGVLAERNLVAVFSGHLHLNLDTVPHQVRDHHGVYHIHVPGLERTKIGGEHIPRFRLLTIHAHGQVHVETYNLNLGAFEPQHGVKFALAAQRP